jgi:small subunit ribosomal protein S4
LSERQLSNYAQAAFAEKDPSAALNKSLELRADNVVYRAALSPTRRAARQAVSHGHITVNGRRITTPSYHLKKGDVISIREGSRRSSLFAGLTEAKEENTRSIPQWLDVDMPLLKAELKGEPVYNQMEAGLDYPTVFEFYSR